MKKNGFAFFHLLLSAVRYFVILLVSVVLGIVGMFGVTACLYIGGALLALFVILCVISTVRMEKLINYRSKDDLEFNDLMDQLTDDPHAVISQMIEIQEKHRSLHGKELLTLSDKDLFETVSFQVIEIADDPQTGDYDPRNLSRAQETVYVLSTFDGEVRNGGLCQFFVNSSREIAPLVSDCLQQIGADEHRRLYEDFAKKNSINLSNLSSFKVKSIRGYFKQTRRYDFDAFDDAYCQLPSLQDRIVAYIRTNIDQF